MTTKQTRSINNITRNVIKNQATNLPIPCTDCKLKRICKFAGNVGTISASSNFVISVDCIEKQKIIKDIESDLIKIEFNS